MSAPKVQEVYNLLLQFYSGHITRAQLEENLRVLTSSGSNANFNRFLSSCILLNELRLDSLEQKMKSEPAPNRRRLLLHMRALRQADISRCNIDLFNVYGRQSQLAKVSNWQDAIQIAALLELPVSVVMDGGTVPVPRSEPPWYQYLDSISDRESTFIPRKHTDFFEHSSVVFDNANPQAIGLAALWLRNGFTSVSFTVADGAGDLDTWEQRLIAHGAKRQLVGPSIYTSRRMLFHEAPHRVHHMIWTQRLGRIPKPNQTYELESQVMLQLCAHIFSPSVSEVSFFRGLPGELLPRTTIKYPQHRKIEVTTALKDIGFIWNYDETRLSQQFYT